MLAFLDSLPESHPLIKVKRRLGRTRRWIKRKWWERNIGKQYLAWVADSHSREPQSVDNTTAIAVVVPVFNPPVPYLDECLTSVLQQTARSWQLIVSDDGSTDPEVIAYLDRFEQEHEMDARVIVIRGDNAGISEACNRGLEKVTTEWFGWLDHDDRLNRRAMEIFSESLTTDPSIDIIYSDEDKIDTRGRHFELYCKPDYSPELLLTQMYLCHFTAFRTSLVREAGGFRSSMDGAQDFDLALRLMDRVKNIKHIAHPLYHWRAWSNSTALTIDAKPWAQQAAARAQEDHLQRAFGGGVVKPSSVPGLNEVHPDVSMLPTVSVIIPTIGTRDPQTHRRFVEAAVASLRQLETQVPLEIIAVTTGVIDDIPGVDKQVVYQTEDFNFAEAINLGRKHATGDYLLLLNDDTSAASDLPVSRLLEIGQQPGVGVTGALLTYPDGRIQHAGIVLLPSGPTHAHIAKPGKWPGYFGSTLTPRNYSAVTAAAMLVRTSIFDEMDGFDTAFARDFNDVDFCMRVGQAGYRVAWTPYAHFIHFEGVSIVRKQADPQESQLFAQRWSAALASDPYYSQALSPQLARIYEPL